MEDLVPVFQQVVDLLPSSFDAHQFIVELLRINPYAYFAVLRKTNERVFQANGLISNHLKNNAILYRINYMGKHISADIYSNPSECALFNKL